MEIVFQCSTGNAVIEPIRATNRLVHSCPCCGHRCRTHDYDEYDLLSEKYGIDRTFFAAADRLYNPVSLIAFIAREEFGLIPQPTSTQGYQAITVHCFDCQSRFRIRHLQQTTFDGAHFCVYCGSPKTLALQDNDLDYWEILGEAYSMPADLIKSVYELWELNSKVSFAVFMASLRKELVTT